MFLDVAGLTDRGKVRRRNTDQLLIAELNKSVIIRSSTLSTEREKRLAAATVGHLMLVADGWRNSGVAERVDDFAVFTSVEYVMALLPWFFEAVKGAGDASVKLHELIDNTSASLRPSADDSSSIVASAVTMTIALLVWPAVFVVHRGTSRLYLLRGRNLHNLTADGAPRSKQSAAELPSHGLRALRSQLALTTPMGVRMHVHQATIAHGDTMLLCTDGLTTGVTDEQIAQVLREDRPADSACLSLIHAANDAGGVDNTSVIVARALDHD